MKFSAILALVVVLACATRSAQAIQCPSRAEKCGAWTALKMYVVGSGKCWGKATAKCDAVAISTKCIKAAYDAEHGGCPGKAAATAYARCYALALAGVYTSAYVNIQCTGSGKGCGYAHANGEAWACSYAAAFATSVVSLGGNHVTCHSQVGALAAVFAKAASRSRAKACSAYGYIGKDFDVDFALNIQKAIATAYTACYAECKAKTLSVAEGEAEVVVTEKTVDSGPGAYEDGGEIDFPWHVLG